MIIDVTKINVERDVDTVGCKDALPKNKRMNVTDFSRRRLDKYYQHWCSLRKNKHEFMRNYEYYNGDQWHELVEGYDGTVMTERQNISGQGKVPLQYNIIKPACNSVSGQFRTDKSKSVVVPRSIEQKKECEVLSNALQSVLDTNDARELDAAALSQKFWGMPVQRVCFKYLPEQKEYDVFLENINIFSMFFNVDQNDVRGYDMNIIGRVIDYTFPQLIAAFAKGNMKLRKRLKEIYAHRDDMQYVANMNGINPRDLSDLDFFIPKDLTKCRVIEAWEKIVVDRTEIHDTYDGTISITDYTLDEVMAMNKARMEKRAAAGKDVSKTPLLIPTVKAVEVWHYFYLSPYGHVLAEGETPYWHGSHPFVMPMFQLRNGKINTFVGDMIDPQRYANRLLTLWDFILGTSAKNTLIVDKDSLAGQNIEDIAEDYRQVGGVIALKLKDGQKAPFELGKNMANLGITDMLQLMFKLNQDISGVHPSMQGQQAPSGTSGKLYAQEAQNASINTKEFMESFATFRRIRNEKVLKTIQQFYNAPRYISISGKRYQDSVQLYDPKDVQHVEWKMQIAQSSDSPVYRALIDEYLIQFLEKGFIDFPTYLENTNLPYSDSLLESVNKASEQAQQGDAAGAMNTIGQVPANNENVAKAEQLLKRA